MANYKDPFALPNPESIAHEANKIFMKLIDDGNEVYHMYEKFYFFKTSRGAVFFGSVKDMVDILYRSDLLPYWCKTVQNAVCKEILNKCLAAAKPWKPLPDDPRKITPNGTKPNKVDYQLYMQDVIHYGMHKTPDGRHEKLYPGKTPLPITKRGRKAKAVVASAAAPQVQISAPASASVTPNKIPATDDRQEDLIGVALPESECHIDPQDGTRLLTDMMLRESVIEKTKEE